MFCRASAADSPTAHNRSSDRFDGFVGHRVERPAGGRNAEQFVTADHRHRNEPAQIDRRHPIAQQPGGLVVPHDQRPLMGQDVHQFGDVLRSQRRPHRGCAACDVETGGSRRHQLTDLGVPEVDGRAVAADDSGQRGSRRSERPRPAHSRRRDREKARAGLAPVPRCAGRPRARNRDRGSWPHDVRTSAATVGRRSRRLPTSSGTHAQTPCRRRADRRR